MTTLTRREAARLLAPVMAVVALVLVLAAALF